MDHPLLAEQHPPPATLPIFAVRGHSYCTQAIVEGDGSCWKRHAMGTELCLDPGRPALGDNQWAARATGIIGRGSAGVIGWEIDGRVTAE